MSSSIQINVSRNNCWIRHLLKWLTIAWLQPSSLILGALHISAYPWIHMCSDTAGSSQWWCREEMVLEGCQAGSSKWPYMVKSAVSMTERHQWESGGNPDSIEVLQNQPGELSSGELASSVKYHTVQTRQHCLMSIINAGGGIACIERLTPNTWSCTCSRAWTWRTALTRSNTTFT